MSVALRTILIIMSVLMLTFIVRKIRKSRLKIEYSLFWIVVSVIILILSIFPQIVVKLAVLLGIVSPVNFIYLVIIFILLVHGFYQTQKTSQLENMIQNLTEEIAVRKEMENDEE